MTNKLKNGENNGKKRTNKGWANLIPPIKPGEVRNPTGRPKGKLNYDTRVDMAMEVIALKYMELTNKKNKKVKGYKPLTLDDIDIEGDIFAQHVNKARNGDHKSIDSFMDRRHGKATQKVELTGKDGSPVAYEEKLKEAKDNILKNQAKWFKPRK